MIEKKRDQELAPPPTFSSSPAAMPGDGHFREFEDANDDHQAWDAFRSAEMVSLNISFPDDGDLPHAVIKALAETKNCQFEDVSGDLVQCHRLY